jgi:hypothetical protein
MGEANCVSDVCGCSAFGFWSGESHFIESAFWHRQACVAGGSVTRRRMSVAGSFYDSAVPVLSTLGTRSLVRAPLKHG